MSNVAATPQPLPGVVPAPGDWKTSPLAMVTRVDDDKPTVRKVYATNAVPAIGDFPLLGTNLADAVLAAAKLSKAAIGTPRGDNGLYTISDGPTLGVVQASDGLHATALGYQAGSMYSWIPFDDGHDLAVTQATSLLPNLKAIVGPNQWIDLSKPADSK